MPGSIQVTSSDLGQGVTRYAVAWTSDASGNVSGNSFDVKGGRLYQARFLPGSGAGQPTDLYDLTLLDADGIDYLDAAGANLSNVNASVAANTRYMPPSTLTPTISNAGISKSGTLVLLIGP